MRTWPALDVGPLPEPDLFQAALVDYEVAAIDESTQPDAWRVFFSSEAARDIAAQSLSRQFPHTVVRRLDVPDEDWVTRAQASLRAVKIGDIVVAPPWDVPDAPSVGRRLQPARSAARLSRRATRPQPLVVIIRPSMGFGTGHHATTRMCLAALQRVNPQGRRVIDVGTGSGLLAIAASRLGAASVVGVDEDPDALGAAQENLSLNPGTDVTLRRADVRRMAPEPFDVIVANLTGALLRDAAPQIQGLAAPGASLILSGFLRAEQADVLTTYSTFTAAARTEGDEWLCVTLRP